MGPLSHPPALTPSWLPAAHRSRRGWETTLPAGKGSVAKLAWAPCTSPSGQWCVPFRELASQRLWAVLGGQAHSPGPAPSLPRPMEHCRRGRLPPGPGPGPGPYPSWALKARPSDGAAPPPPTLLPLPGTVQLLPTPPLIQSFEGFSTSSHFTGAKAWKMRLPTGQPWSCPLSCELTRGQALGPQHPRQRAGHTAGF